MIKIARRVLPRYFDPFQLLQLISAARQEFKNIVPRLPYIGGKQPFTEFIVLTGMQLALYRTALASGKSIHEIGNLAFEMGRSFISKIPPFLLRFFIPVKFSTDYFTRLKQRALISHRREYLEDYVYNFIEGDGKTFDYGVDYIECAACKFLEREGAYELAQYLCPADILYSETLGWGLTRTQTLAQGGDCCDFRFKKGGPTHVAVPPGFDTQTK